MPQSKKDKSKRRRYEGEPSPKDLFSEMTRLIKSVDSLPTKAKPPGTKSQKTRLVKLQKALSSGATFDALEKVRELIPDDGVGAQEVVVYGFACILEANSAGLSILFDRFEDDELRKIHSSLKSIGATRTLTALRGLQKSFERAIADGRTRVDASEFVGQLPDAQKHDRESQAYVDEMEQKLLGFCNAHLRELAGG